MAVEGKHILSTRAMESNDEFESVLIGHGAFVECFPTIKISPIEHNEKLDEILGNINSYDGIFFTSVNGVKHFWNRAKDFNFKYEGKIYSVGSRTGRELTKYGYKPDFTPKIFSSDGLIDELNKDEIKGKKFLLPRGNLSVEKLGKELSKYSNVDEVVVYETICPVYDEEYINWMQEIINSKGFDCITYFSPSSIQNFFSLLGDISLDGADIAVIGNTTYQIAKEKGLNVNILPIEFTSEILAKTIVEFYNGKN